MSVLCREVFGAIRNVFVISRADISTQKFSFVQTVSTSCGRCPARTVAFSHLPERSDEPWPYVRRVRLHTRIAKRV